MAIERYNGWANYETWNVVLWLRNDEGMYRRMLDEAKLWKQNYDTITAGVAKQIVAVALIETETPDQVSLYDTGIDWQEVADAIQEDIS